MEIIVLVSVLSTLGVVAIITAIVVAFIKLRGKVDVNLFNKTTEQIHHRIDETNNQINRYIEENSVTINNRIDELYRLIDSRCDKLDSKIKEIKK